MQSGFILTRWVKKILEIRIETNKNTENNIGNNTKNGRALLLFFKDILFN